MDIRFQQLESLHWLWTVAALVVVVVVGFHLRRRALARFATSGLLGSVLARVSPGRQVVRAVLVLAALPCLVAAMIDPRWGVTYQPVQQRGIDIVVVLDLSRSMLAEDVKPNRVDRARQFIGDLVERLGGDRIALVTFAGTATIACPLTVDYGAFLLTLDVASVETVPRGGSLLGDAIRVAGTAFTDELPDHKAIIIFSDGEDQGSYPRQAVESLMAELPVPIYTVGIGDAEEGARIPVTVDDRGRRRARAYLTHEGQEVWSKLDAALLQAIALDSGGAYVPVGTGTVDMGLVYEEKIEPVAKREYEVTQRKLYQARYQWFAGLALVLLLVESFMSDRRVVKSPARAVAEAVRNRPLGPGPGKKTRLAALALAALPVLLGTGPANAPAPPAPPATPSSPAAAEASPRKLAAEAARAMEEQRYGDAISLYDALRGVLPDTAEIPYNQGVAAYRAGDLERAEAFFRQTLDVAQDPMLRAQSAYNLGTTAHRRTLEQTAGAPGAPAGAVPPGADPADSAGAPAPSANPIGEAMEELDRAIAHYRDALDTDPADLDARANAEMAWNLRQQLEQMQQQQQQNQQGEGDDENQEEQDEQQDQQQDQQGEQSGDQQDQRDQSPPGEDQQDQQESQGEQDQPSPEQQESDGEQDQPQSGEQEQGGEQPPEEEEPADGGEQQDDDEQEPPAAQGEQEQTEDEPRRMSREEAERLLQGVRDKERRRREELARREASRLPPVTKDW